MMHSKLIGVVAGLALVHFAVPSFSQTPPTKPPAAQPADAAFGDLIGKEPAGASKPTPRAADGHPDFTGF